MILLNLGSGQRKFPKPWINIDVSSKHEPDIACNINNLDALKFDYPEIKEGNIDVIILHHVLEHFHLGELNIKSLYDLLKPGGSLLIFVPDIRKLAQRWLTGQISDYIFMVNVYGAYQGEPGDDHHWNFTAESLAEHVLSQAPFKAKMFDWRNVHDADIARDFWILGMEFVK